MQTDDFKRIAGDLLGNSWQTRLARVLGVDGSTVRRWVGSGIPVPSTVAAFLDVLADRQRTRGELIAERQGLGAAANRPVHYEVPEPFEIEWMTKKLAFPGIDHPKPMPAISCEGVSLTMTGEAVDVIQSAYASFVLTRHPDSQHLAGYLRTAERHGHRAAVLKHRFHFYSLLAYGAEKPIVTHQICTHAGEIRTITSDARTPHRIETSTLE